MGQYRVTAHALNLRERPSTANDPVGALKMNMVVEVSHISPDAKWGYVKAPKSGWASLKYLQAVPKAVTPVVAGADFPWFEIARAEIGQSELPGDQDNPRILEYLRSTSLDADAASHDETHWCSAFMNWVFEEAGYAGTDSAWAKSWMNWGRAIREPVRGCVAVFTREGGGHVALFDADNGDGTIRVLGGNQGNRVCFANYPKSRLLGYRMPTYVLNARGGAAA